MTQLATLHPATRTLQASRTLHPFKDKVDWLRYAAKRIETRYYNPDLHYASFLLPTQVAGGRCEVWKEGPRHREHPACAGGGSHLR